MKLFFAAMVITTSLASPAFASVVIDQSHYMYQWTCNDGTLPTGANGSNLTYDCTSPIPQTDTMTMMWRLLDRLGGAGYGALGGIDNVRLAGFTNGTDAFSSFFYQYSPGQPGVGALGYCGDDNQPMCIANNQGTSVCNLQYDVHGNPVQWGPDGTPCSDGGQRMITGQNNTAWQTTQDGSYGAPGTAPGGGTGSGYVAFFNGPNCGYGGWTLFPYTFAGWDQWETNQPYEYDDNVSHCPASNYWTYSGHDVEITQSIPWVIEINGVSYNNQYVITIVEDHMLSSYAAERDYFIRNLGLARVEGWCVPGYKGPNGTRCPSTTAAACAGLNWGSQASPYGPGGSGWVIQDCQEFTDIEPWWKFWQYGVGQTVQSVFENYMDSDFWGGL